MLNSRIALFGLIIVLFASLVLAETPEQNFYQELNQNISTSNVEQGESVLPQHYPSERPEGIFGVTYWPNGSLAPYTWVYAQAKDAPGINAWAHTTWTIYDAFYVHSRNQPNPIPLGHAYYIKGLHWIPRNTPDFPPAGSEPFPPPEWANGMVTSPTYETSQKYARPEEGGSLQIPIDVCLSGDPVMW